MLRTNDVSRSTLICYARNLKIRRVGHWRIWDFKAISLEPLETSPTSRFCKCCTAFSVPCSRWCERLFEYHDSLGPINNVYWLYWAYLEPYSVSFKPFSLQFIIHCVARSIVVGGDAPIVCKQTLLFGVGAPYTT